VILQKYSLVKNITICILNTINNTNLTGKLLLLQKLAKVGQIYHKIWGYFSHGMCICKQKKEKKFSRSQENGVRRMIFYE
jgi:hypothetical protein